MSKRTRQTKSRSFERELARLRRELEAERRRTAALEREVTDLRRQLQSGALERQGRPIRRLRRRGTDESREVLLLEAANRRAHHHRKGSFLRYLWETVMESAPVLILSKLIRYLRRIRAVQLILTVILALGAVVTVAVVGAAVLPFLLFGTASLSILALARSRRMNRILAQELAGRAVRVFIPPRGGSLKEGSFFIRNARAMAGEGVAVLVVSPYPMSHRGLGGKGSFFTARKEAEGIYLVRRHYFFMLRKRVLDAMGQNITMIY